MKSAEYWQKRALAREAQAARAADKELADKVLRAYDAATRQLTEDARTIFERYRIDGKMTPEQARKMLSVRESDAVILDLKKRLDTITDPDIKRKAIKRIEARAYAARITRAEAMRERIYAEMAVIAGKEKASASSLLAKTYKDTYYRSVYDTQQGLNMAYDFTMLPKGAIDAVIAENWSGAHFSQRIWNNTQHLADELFQVMTQGLASGMSIHRMAIQLADTMQTGKYAATRLLRTEANRAYNEAEYAAYIDEEVEKYRYMASLDARTCKKCGALDGQVFNIEDKETGKNYPPLHANDRCTTIAFWDDEVYDRIKRRAKDPETGKPKVIDDITYDEWYKQNEEKIQQAQKQARESSGTKAQYNRYKERLGDDAPSTLQKFEQMKAKNGEKWVDLQKKLPIHGYHAAHG